MKNLGHNSGNDETLPPKQDPQFCKILKRTHRSVKSLKMTPIILLLFQKVPLKHGKSPYHRDNKIPPRGQLTIGYMGVWLQEFLILSKPQNKGRVLGPNPRIWMKLFPTTVFLTQKIVKNYCMTLNLNIPRISGQN